MDSRSPEHEGGDPTHSFRAIVQRVGLVGGPVLAAAVYLALPTAYEVGGGESIALPHAARATLAATVWMAVWWLSEAIPVYATALLPLALFPITGIASGKAAAAPYGHPLIFLFMGGGLSIGIDPQDRRN